MERIFQFKRTTAEKEKVIWFSFMIPVCQQAMAAASKKSGESKFIAIETFA